MYHTYYSQPRKTGGYLLPFLSLIIVGLIVVLVFQMVTYFQEKRMQSLENKAAVKIIAGTAEMKIWGVEQWVKAFDNSILNEGDIIRTGHLSRVILSLQNGSLIRMDKETEIEFAELKTKDGKDEAAIHLKQGEIWLKRADDQNVRSAFSVLTKNLELKSFGSIFDVVQTNEQAVRVLSGKAAAVIKVKDLQNTDDNEMRAADTADIVFGQELVLTQREIEDFENRKTLDLLALLSDDFRDTDWYKWNRKEDAEGKPAVTVADAVNSKVSSPLAEIIPKKVDQIETPPQEVAAVPSVPQILTPKENERKTSKGEILISGIVSKNTQKVEVSTYISGKAEPYVLQKYVPSSEKWSYLAAAHYGNLVAGENRFTVVAIGTDGKKSDSAEIIITYDKPLEPADLSVPSITSFNGVSADAASFETTEDSVLVNGKIGKGITKVFVNDFVLTKYVPSSGVWGYYAKTQYENLREGENEYSVYGVDAEGNKTSVYKFTIVKKAKPAPLTPKEEPAI
ncbi:FecR domain-containing protein [Candidatus Peregrinibacteria bacterium]|nr:FecR domain-containing protein [Candidatus Peregrinibacteria bacterium]